MQCMGAALVFPIVVIVMLAAVWFVFGARKTRQQAEDDKTLPVDPTRAGRRRPRACARSTRRPIRL